MSNIGERIKEQRKRLGLSAEDLANKIGISRSTMFRYERGAVDKIPADVITSISDVLGVATGYLMGRDDIHPQQIELTRLAGLKPDDYIASKEPTKKEQLIALINLASEEQLDLLISLTEAVIKNRKDKVER